jgi:hypothetical protein
MNAEVMVVQKLPRVQKKKKKDYTLKDLKYIFSIQSVELRPLAKIKNNKKNTNKNKNKNKIK